MGLKALKDIEHQSHLDAAEMGLDRQADLVTGPHNVLGIELNEYAAELARVTVWIGELQWRLERGFPFKQNPVLEPLDHIECRDALLTFDAVGTTSEACCADSGARPGQRPGAHEPAVPKSPQTSAQPTPRSDLGERKAGEQSGAAAGMGVRSEFRTATSTATSNAERNSALTPILAAGSTPTTPPVSVVVGGKIVSEASWPKANVVIGNPPFLGDKKMRAELGDDYTETLRKVYAGRVPGGADLVTYWFEKARYAIETNGLGAAGLVATNSIRGGKNRVVLDAITRTTRIFEAWSDESWVNDGAAVRVSLVAFGASAQELRLSGTAVTAINSDLTSQEADLTSARRLIVNRGCCYYTTVKAGSFDVTGAVARAWLAQPNPNGRPNSDVVKPWINAMDLTRRNADKWSVDFGCDMDLDLAMLYEAPFAHVLKYVKPEREKTRRDKYRNFWWLFAEPIPGLRTALVGISRFIATPAVAKYRAFVWVSSAVVPDHALMAIARSDDTTFGILHSRFHELWSLRMGTSLEDRPRYTPTSCFETFPFPQGLTPADTARQRTETLEGGAVIPAGLSESSMPVAPIEQAREATKNVAPESAETGVRAEFRSPFMVAVKAVVLNSDLTPLSSVSADPLPPITISAGSLSSRQRSDQDGGWAAEGSAQVKEEPAQRAGDTEQVPLPPSRPEQATPFLQPIRNNATAIANAAKRLNDLREAWLNPPEWTDRVPEVTPLGMDHSPYPDRIVPKAGHEKDLAERTLTKLYNQRPAWLDTAHKRLDMAVAQAYGWSDYRAVMQDEEILKRLLALNLERASNSA
jgi:hypothetical protein